MTDRPNIFKFATKELSQDAFIAWLASWAQKDLATEDPELHEAGKRFLDALLRKAKVEVPNEYSEVDVRLQEQKVDILVLVNTSLAILVEDKTNSKPHSGQLNKYLDCVETTYSGRDVTPIYLKTGEIRPQERREVEQARYAAFLRKDLMAVLAGVQTSNEVFGDFRDHMEEIDAAIASYGTRRLEEWDKNRSAWQGFFTALADNTRIHARGWDYVPNRAGGFMGFWWHTRQWGAYDVYLQLEDAQLCFKIAVPKKSEQSAARNAWHRVVMEAARSGEFPVKKPPRFGKGKWMTAVIFEGDYMWVSPNRMVDIPATVAVMKKAEELLDRAVALGE